MQLSWNEASTLPYVPRRGDIVDILKDYNVKECQINLKRFDRQWTDWQYAENRTLHGNEEYKEINIFMREVTMQEAHGGITGDAEMHEETKWLKWVREKLAWDEALENCRSKYSGKLFYNLDGSIGQLEWFSEKMEASRYWLGIYTEDHQVWTTIDGVAVTDSLLVWKSGQPSNNAMKKYVTVGGQYSKKLKNFEKTRQQYSICLIV